MNFKTIIHLISLLLVLNIAASTSILPETDYAASKLSPASILKADQPLKKHFSKPENKKIEHIVSQLAKKKDNLTNFINILKRNKPTLTQEALRIYLQTVQINQKIALKHIKLYITENAINQNSYEKILVPLLNNFYLFDEKQDSLSLLALLIQINATDIKLQPETKNKIITDVINIATKKNTPYLPDDIIKKIFIPILNHPTSGKILVKALFPPIYQQDSIHLTLRNLNTNIQQYLLKYILYPEKNNNSLNKNIMRILSESNSMEKEDKISKFLNHNYIRIQHMSDFCKQNEINISESLMDFIIRRRQISLLEAINPPDKNPAYISLLKNLINSEYANNKNHNIIKNAVLNIYEIFTFNDGQISVSEDTTTEINALIEDFRKNKIGNKKFLEKTKTIKNHALYLPIIDTITKMAETDSDVATDNLKTKIVTIMDKDPDTYKYLANLCNIYSRTASRFNTTGAFIRKTIKYLIAVDGDLPKLNKWLYTEAPWNKAAYKTLIKNGYNPTLWETPLKQTYFANRETTKKVQKLIQEIKKLKLSKNLSESKSNYLEFLLDELNRIKKEEPKIIVELAFDFLKDSYSGAILHDSISPHKKFEVIPLAIALETNSVFMHVYNEATKKPFSSILFTLTPNGLVDMGFPTDSPELDQPVFDAIAQLVGNGSIPAVNLNSEKTSYVASATYNFAFDKKLLKAEKKESVKKEPWNLFSKVAPSNPRHYATGKNITKDGQQYGVFKTSFTLNKTSIKKYQSVSLENIEKDISVDIGKHLYGDFLNNLRQKVLAEAETKKDSKLYIKEIMPSLTILKNYMQKHNLLPERLAQHTLQLNKILPPALVAIIDEEIKYKSLPLNSFFTDLFHRSQTQKLAPTSA